MIVELFSVVGYRLSAAAAAVALSIAMITNNSVITDASLTHELIAARQTDRHHCVHRQ